MHDARGSTNTTDDLPIGETARTVVSLLLFVHCFCMVAVLSANYLASPLQQRMVSLFAPYARLLNFDPNFTRFHLTHAAEEHDDHVIEVTLPESPNAPLVLLPDVGWRGGERYKRYQRLASAMAFAANREFDSVSGEFARAVGAHVMAEQGVSRVVVRCRWLRAEPMDPSEPQADGGTGPGDSPRLESTYEADVWIADDDSVQILKKSSRREVAPTVDRAS